MVKMKSIHKIITITSGKKYGTPAGKELNTRLQTLWTLHQKHKIDTTSSIKRKSRKI
jgi:predicted ATPase